MSTILALSFPSSNNQLETLSNPVYQDAMKERQTLSCVDNSSKSNDDMTRKYTHSNTVQHTNCFKQKMLLVQLQEAEIQLSKDQLAILTDTGERIDLDPGAFTVTTNALFQVEGVKSFDSDCDDLPNAQPSFMANILSSGSDVLSEVPHSDNTHYNMINQSVQAMPSSEQSNVVNHSETEITSDSNIIPYSQYVRETQQAAVQNSNSSAQQDALILSVIEQLKTQVINYNMINLDNKNVNDTLTAELERYKEQVEVLKEGQNVDVKSQDNVVHTHEQNAEIDRLKQTLSEQLKEKESLMKTVTVLKNNFKQEESRNIDREIALEKRIKHLDNIKALQLNPMLYDGKVIQETNVKYDSNVIPIPNSKETLILEEESRSKMLLKQSDPMVLEKKVNTKPVDYAALNKLSEDFGKRFVPQTELSVEQAFWSQNSMNSSEPIPSCTPTKVEVLKELPKVSMVNTSLKKLKHHLAGFDKVVKERTTATAITEGTWGFEHTKACFRDEIIPFVKTLKDIFNNFDQYLIDELTKVQTVFIQMEQAVEQHRLELKTFEVKMNQVLNENDRLLEPVINKDIVNTVVNFSVDNAYVNVHECQKCLKLETELLNKKDFIEKETYDKLFRIDLTFDQYFELNELKAQAQEKDTVIRKLKERIKSLSGNVNEDKVKKDIDEIETINIELDHRVSKLIAENEHLKQTYKQLYDSIRLTREKGLIVAALKDELRKLKGKSVVDCRESVNKPKVIVLVMLNLDLEPLCPKLKNNREAHVDYIRITKENADTLLDIVEQARTSNLLDNALAYALNDRARAKAVKSIKKKEWKPTGKMFKNVGYKWVPTRRTFTLVGNKCPLTRFTSTKIVPPRKPIKSTVMKNIKPSSASQWRLKETNHASLSSAPKIVESRTANHLEPNNHMGSNVSISPCSSSVQCRSYKSYLGNWIRAALHI
ncbi:hypothetical protein Tco_1561483 [Tanacetum coccineum]